MSKKRNYSPEFKRGAVEQARQTGTSCAQVARELGIGADLLTRWKRKAMSGGRRASDENCWWPYGKIESEPRA